MAFDGIITKTIVTELNNTIIGGKLNKIYEPTKNEIILGIYANGVNYALNAVISSNNYRLSLTTTTKPNPTNALGFCMLLRKHLIGGKITKIETFGLERIIAINFDCYNELNDLITKKLIIELMGKHSNIILVNEKNIIIDSLRHLDITANSLRDIMPAREYCFPTSEKTDLLSITNFETFYNCIKTIDNLEIAIPNSFTGISKTFMQTAISNLKISTEPSIENCKKIYTYLFTVLNNIKTNANICILTNTGDYTIEPLETLSTTNNPLSPDDNLNKLKINFFIDDYYYQKGLKDTFTEYRNTILRLVSSVLSKISKKLENINSKLDTCEKMDTYKLYGELLTANLYRFKSTNSTNSVEVENYYDNNNTIKIPLDCRYSISVNAKNYFKKYTKLKNALEIVSLQKLETEQELNYLGSVIYELENSKTITDVNDVYNEISENKLFENLRKLKNKTITSYSSKKYSSDSEPLKFTIEGYTVLVGKNNKQNDFLTTKLAKKDDLWFHTKDIHGSHVILQCNHATPDIDIIIKCAELAAYYSKARLSSNVNVDYTIIKNVKKPSGSKPGMVIYTHNESITVKPSKNV